MCVRIIDILALKRTRFPIAMWQINVARRTDFDIPEYAENIRQTALLLSLVFYVQKARSPEIIASFSAIFGETVETHDLYLASLISSQPTSLERGGACSCSENTNSIA